MFTVTIKQTSITSCGTSFKTYSKRSTTAPGVTVMVPKCNSSSKLCLLLTLTSRPSFLKLYMAPRVCRWKNVSCSAIKPIWESMPCNHLSLTLTLFLSFMGPHFTRRMCLGSAKISSLLFTTFFKRCECEPAWARHLFLRSDRHCMAPLLTAWWGLPRLSSRAGRTVKTKPKSSTHQDNELQVRWFTSTCLNYVKVFWRAYRFLLAIPSFKPQPVHGVWSNSASSSPVFCPQMWDAR